MWLVKIHTLVQYKNRLQTRLLIAWWPWNLVKVTEILSLLCPIPMIYLWQIYQNPCIVSLDILQIRLIFTVSIMWWPWKLGQSHKILIKLFIYLFIPMIQYMKFGLNPPFGSRVWVQISFCWVKIWHSKYRCDLENDAKITKIKPLLSLVPKVFLCKFGPNPSIGSGDRMQTRLIFTVFIVWWPWK